MNHNRHRSAPTSPVHSSNNNNTASSSSSTSSTSSPFVNNLNRSSNTNSNSNNRSTNNRRQKGLFGFGAGGGGGGGGVTGNNNFLDQVAQFSNSLHDFLPNSGLISDMGKMLYKSCNSCGNSFSIFVRKKRCDNCLLQFCGSCMEFNDIRRVYQCKRCLVFNEFPLSKDALNMLRVRDLKWYLTTHDISSETYSEKRELIDLIIESRNPPMPTSQSNPIATNSSMTMNGATTNNNINNSQTSTSATAASSSSSPSSSSSQPQQQSSSQILFPNSSIGSNLAAETAEAVVDNSTNSDTINQFADETNKPMTDINSTLLSSPSSSIPSQPIPFNNQSSSSAASSSYPSSSSYSGTSATAPPPTQPPHHKPTLSSDLSASTTNLSTFNLTDINEESEIRSLSIRQLKLLLARNFVDFKGCVERDELINKAVLLWNDRQNNLLKEDDESQDCVIDENICKICMERAIDCVLLECGHMLTCTNCGKILNECPVCRQFVSRVVHVFKA